jgi:thioredoxin-dependent peroxiredoxin
MQEGQPFWQSTEWLKGETDETEEQAIMEARMGEAFAGIEPLTVIGRRLHPGEPAPDYCLSYLDLLDLAVHTVRLPDSAGLVRLLSMVNSLERPLCQMVTQRWEALCPVLPANACIYTVSMDPPEMQARWQDRACCIRL